MQSQQMFFIFSLYIIGFLFTRAFFPKTSLIFSCLTGFLWGAVIHVFFVIIILSTKIVQYNAITTILSEAILTIMFSIIILWKNTRKRITKEVIFVIGYSIILLTVIWYFSKNHYAEATSDSIIILHMGRNLASGELFSWIMGSPKAYGILISALHSSSSFWGMDYYSALQPTISFVFAGILIYGCVDILKSQRISKYIGLFLSVCVTGIFFSTPIIIFNTVYIHTNFISAVYLFTALYSCYTGIQKNSDNYLAIGIISLVGFGFCRTENSIFALLILLILFGFDQISYRKRITISLSYSIVFILWWSLVLLMNDTPYSDVLNSRILIAYISVFLLFVVFTLCSKNKWIEKWFIQRINIWIPSFLFSVFLVMLFIKPKHMILSSFNTIQNFLITEQGGYGTTGIVVSFGILFLLVIRIWKKEFRYKLFDIWGITAVCYLLFIQIMGFFRSPYRLSWADSANRMLISILPILLIIVIVELIRMTLIEKRSITNQPIEFREDIS